MKHEILLLGKTKNKYLQHGIEDFHSRLSHYTKLFLTTLKDSSAAKKGEEAMVAQGKLLLKSVPPGAVKVVLDNTGKQMSSVEFSRLISDWELKGRKHITYLIGGPEGHSREVLGSADFCLSLSKMTFTHDMVRLLLLEQIYRAYTIKAGEQYHK